MRKEYQYFWLSIGVVTLVFWLIWGWTIDYLQPSDEFLSCDSLGVEGHCIEVEFKTTLDDGGNYDSDYSFPQYLRQGDFLWIDKITIIKKPPIYGDDDKGMKEYTLNFKIIPTEGHLEERYFSTEIGREINIGDKYVIEKMDNREYHHIFNGEIVSNERHNEIELNHTGGWHIDFNIIGDGVKRGSLGWTNLFNGKWRGDVFYVSPRHEIENTLTSDRFMRVNIFSVGLIAYIFIIELALMITFRRIDKTDNKIEMQ